MGLRLWLCLLLLASAAASVEKLVSVDSHGLPMDLEHDDLLMMEESARRNLGRSGGYIGYGALDRNNIPCNSRGRSYYSCSAHQKANPYKRSCTKATLCARNNR